MGEKTLSEIITQEGESERVKSLVKQTLKHLFELQEKTQNKIDFSKTFEYEKYDELPITHDLYYFKNYLIDILRVALSQIFFIERVQKNCRKNRKSSSKIIDDKRFSGKKYFGK